jgi:hypothetical protein
MSQIQTGSEATAAALVGSLATFTLFDVLELLARTGHTGELQVVGRGIDQRVWVDRGDLLDPSGEGSNSTALFELACIEEGWFYFTLMGSVPDGQDRIPMLSVLADLGPQVEEWRNLVAFLPFEARVSMSSAAPAPNVQIRSDQWHLLGVVGSPGRTVRAVLDMSDAHPLETLRTLRELIDAQLVSLVVGGGTSSASGLYDSVSSGSSPFEPTPYEPAPRDAPPPPWATLTPTSSPTSSPAPSTTSSTPSSTPSSSGTDPARWTPEEDPGPSTGPVATASVTTGPAATPPPPTTGSAGPPAPPEGWVEREDGLAGGTADDHTTLAVVPGRSAAAESPNGSAMPPPITGDPWSASAGSTAIPLTEQGPTEDPPH